MTRSSRAEDETQRIAADTSRMMLTALWEGGYVTEPLREGETCLLGRGGGVDIGLEHPSISRRHAAIHLGDSLFVEDLGSSNGTRVRGVELVANERTPVAWGEPIELGQVVVVVRNPHLSGRGGLPDPSAPSPYVEVRRMIELCAPTHISVLLLGETGVGKGYLARHLHAHSKRVDGPWLHLNCATLSETLLESELFGHEKGAFTGAEQAKQGLLEAASGGTVFLDEIGDLPPSIQAKLLIAIERREVLRVGALKPRPFDVRFVSATNRFTTADELDGFRSDLYYRLAGLPVVVPPLRARKSEIPDLVREFVHDAAARLGRPVPEIDKECLRVLVAHDWPGNIRELATTIDRALLLSGPTLLREHILLPRRPSRPPSSADLLQPRPASDPAPPPLDPMPPRSLAEELHAAGRERVVSALEQCGGNQMRAAELLGVSRRTLINRMIQFGIRRPRKG